MKKALTLFSAGLDSTVSLALARESGVKILQGLAFDYGQQAAESEWRQAQKLAEYYHVPLQKIALSWLDEITETALSKNSSERLPEIPISQLDQIATVTLASANKVWVPNRNGLMINIAGAFADSRGYDGIITGFNAEEAATFPDNTPSFQKLLHTVWLSQHRLSLRSDLLYNI